ncbi:nuclease-related domain-containing protein [Jeotgalibaca sp. A122]|uniref:nuclease-related domain-containing protein n=1 Tax=Jeotgalibaca sp. A122 TaxID=3457322 RepID=UPI003FD3FC21
MVNGVKTEIHQILHALERRFVLPTELQSYLANLDRGLGGEDCFREVLEGLTCAHVLLRDVRLRLDANFFQIDALLLTGKQVIVFEVKNWGGAFEYADGQIVSKKSGKPYKNPREQLNRCVVNLQYLLKTWGFDFEVVGRVVFIDPTFYLYNAPIGLPFLFVPELNEWVKALNRFDGWIGESHRRLGELLVARHCPAKVDYDLLPVYTFKKLKKGMDCQNCGGFGTRVAGQRVRCLECGCEERAETAIVRWAVELQLLFPKVKVTSRLVGDFCDNQFEVRRIHRSLRKHFEQMGTTKGAYFIIRPFAPKITSEMV